MVLFELWNVLNLLIAFDSSSLSALHLVLVDSVILYKSGSLPLAVTKGFEALIIDNFKLEFKISF